MAFDLTGLLVPLWLAVAAGTASLALLHLARPGLRLLRLQSRLTVLLGVLTLLPPVTGADPGLLPLSDGRLGWFLAAFVILLTAVVQTFCIRFLQGDTDQGRAFAWLTLLMTGAVAAWLAIDTRVLLAGWGLALFALARLIGLAQDWSAARAAARYAGGWFLAAWLALAGVVWILYSQTGTWSAAPEALLSWTPVAQHVAAGLLVLAVIIPAAQWPAHRWLMATMVAPTPVSAIMHAGIVNAGAILLVRFGGLFEGAEWARNVLLSVSVVSILLGGGMMMVQADVKRKLAASTVAQMGCMLLQCALGAYLAAIIHVLLHGLFKANLFLQAGAALEAGHPEARVSSFLRVFLPALVMTGALVWIQPEWQSAGPAQWLSALLLAWFAAQALASYTQGLQWRTLPFWITALGGFLIVQVGLRYLLASDIPQGAAPADAWVYAAALGLVGGTALLYQAARARSGPLARRAYWFFVHESEAPSSTLDPHPAHLARRIRQGDFA